NNLADSTNVRINAATLLDSTRASWSRIFPSSVQVAALQGNILGSKPRGSAANTDWRPFPSATTGVTLLAAGNVADVWIKAGDAVRAALRLWNTPVKAAPTGAVAIAALDGADRLRLVAPTQDPLRRYTVIAQDGDISDSSFEFPRRSLVSAGRDIVNIVLNLQNLSSGDESRVVAGRDLRYTQTTPAKEQVGASSHFILIGGPGRLTVQAGRDIDFGNAAGIMAVGNLLNRSLTSPSSA